MGFDAHNLQALPSRAIPLRTCNITIVSRSCVAIEMSIGSQDVQCSEVAWQAQGKSRKALQSWQSDGRYSQIIHRLSSR